MRLTIPIVLQLDLKVEFVKFVYKVHTPRSSWEKAKDGDLTNYRLSLSSYLADIPIPHETLVCRDFTCCNAEHGRAIQGCYQYFPKVSPIFDIDTFIAITL